MTLLIVKFRMSLEKTTIKSLTPNEAGVTEAKLESTDTEL